MMDDDIGLLASGAFRNFLEYAAPLERGMTPSVPPTLKSLSGAQLLGVESNGSLSVPIHIYTRRTA